MIEWDQINWVWSRLIEGYHILFGSDHGLIEWDPH